MSFNLDDNTIPPTIIIEIRYHISGEYILRERINTSAVNAPTPTECSEIFHHKLIIVTIRDKKKAEKINDFKKTGIGKRNTIYEVTANSEIQIFNGVVKEIEAFEDSLQIL